MQKTSLTSFRVGKLKVHLLKPLSDVHLAETMCRVKFSDTILQGQSNSERSKVACTLFLPTPHPLNLWSGPENISHTENKTKLQKIILPCTVSLNYLDFTVALSVKWS